jgi:hypothetical protein
MATSLSHFLVIRKEVFSLIFYPAPCLDFWYLHKTANTNPLTIQLSLVPQNAKDFDPAEIGELSRDVFADLKKAGYSITPAYTGEKGNWLFDVVTFLTPLAQSGMVNKELLVALFNCSCPSSQTADRSFDQESRGLRQYY